MPFARTTIFRRVRARTLGLFVVLGVALPLASCARPDPAAQAAGADRAARTGLYTWLLGHEPGAIVAWHVSPAVLAPLVPDTREIVVAGPKPCAQARALHGAIVLAASAATASGRHERDVALDCGIALYHDEGGLVIAPR